MSKTSYEQIASELENWIVFDDGDHAEHEHTRSLLKRAAAIIRDQAEIIAMHDREIETRDKFDHVGNQLLAIDAKIVAAARTKAAREMRNAAKSACQRVAAWWGDPGESGNAAARYCADEIEQLPLCDKSEEKKSLDLKPDSS